MKWEWKWSDRVYIQSFMWMLWIIGLNKDGHCMSENQLKRIYIDNYKRV